MDWRQRRLDMIGVGQGNGDQRRHMSGATTGESKGLGRGGGSMAAVNGGAWRRMAAACPMAHVAAGRQCVAVGKDGRLLRVAGSG